MPRGDKSKYTSKQDRKADHIRMIDGIGVKPAQVAGFRVRVRERLKINDELVRVESFADVCDALANLIANGIRLDGRWRPKRIVVAVGATADRDCAIAIRACESRVDDDLINALAEFFLEPAVVGTESLGFA